MEQVTNSSRFISILILTALVSFSATANGQDVDDDTRARELFEEGEASYAAGGYDKAVALFTEAYALSKRPALLFNIASAEERRGNFRTAAAMLRKYLESPGATDIDAINVRIANLERRAVASEKREAERVALETKLAEAEAKAGAIPSASREPETMTTPAPAPAPSGVRDRPSATPGVALLIVGGSFVAGGAVLGLISRSAASDAEDSCRPNGLCPADAKDDFDRAESLALAADISIGVGVTAAVVGTYLLYRRSKTKETRSVAIDIAPTPGGAFANVFGRF